jgi:ABC-type lipoprotein export system ATPase subunit
MRKIKIKNIGPLEAVEIELARVNVIIGPQSSGKSCVLKIACFCTWVEKKIELTQSTGDFSKDGYFIQELTRFHKLKGYFKNDSYIGYESDHMKFSYDAFTGKFDFEWKEKRWDYFRPKVSYIPAERNMVAAIPNWFDVKLYDDNIQSFMADWDRARKTCKNYVDILNLGVSYKYDEQSKKDIVKVDEDDTIELTNTSSGLQSLIPLFVHLGYIGNMYNLQNEAQSYANRQLSESFLNTMYEELFKKKEKTKSAGSLTLADIGPFMLEFANIEFADECREIYDRYVKTHHAEVFLEEPENNLFPPTQVRLVDWLLRMTEGNNGACLFVATHSPYMMTAFLERELKDFRLFFEKKKGKKSTVVTASETDVQEIYDDGIDVFYNIESYT